MKLPNVSALVTALTPIKREATKLRQKAAISGDHKEFLASFIVVNVQVLPEGWKLHRGERRADDDHEGFWGEECVDPKCDLKLVAESILEELMDQMYIHGEAN